MEAVKKALMHDNGTNITEVAKNLGLPISTLYGWVQAIPSSVLRTMKIDAKFDEFATTS